MSSNLQVVFEDTGCSEWNSAITYRPNRGELFR